MILFLNAWAALLVYDILSSVCPFRKMYCRVKRWKVVQRKTDSDAIDHVCRAVNYAAVWYPKRTLCLQRSFVTTYLLRKHGVPAQMVLGAQKLPFKAHAWVEINGQPINERSNARAAYAVWDRY